MDGVHPTGGSAELAELIDQYGEILVPELRHYFGIDVRQVLTGEMSPRYVLLHIKYLPVESSFVSEHRGGQKYRGWDESRYMMAHLIDSIRALQHIIILANRDPKKRKPDVPLPYPIPDTRDKKKGKSIKPGSFAHMAYQRLASVKARKKRDNNA